MKKLAYMIAAAGLLSCSPAIAQDWKCDESNLTEMKGYVDKLDSKSLEEGSREWEAANAAMRANNMEECTLRMTNVNKLLGGKNLERALETAKDKSDTNDPNNANTNQNP
ncbi:MAG: hypothetical protein JNM45_15150 [Rhizobiales bacterium]|nr:hypothetical protein [Hyphomicrobiales bacterium]